MQSEAQIKGRLNRMTLIGVGVGLLLPLSAYFFDFHFKGIGVSLSKIVYLHQHNYYLFVLDLMPVIMYFATRFFGRKFLINNAEYDNYVKRSNDKTDIYYNYVVDMTKGDFGNLNNEENDKLTNSLIELGKNLSKAKDEEDKRRKEDEQRNWEAQGIANFSEIVRNYSNSISDLSYQLISNLVKYTDSNQGGVYILNDEDKANRYFVLEGAYAYSRNKYCDRQIPWGEGLIGSCGIERNRIYIKKVPDTYIDITSGLGHAVPKVLLIVPMISNDEMLGVIEIAAFDELEEYKIRFVEKVAEIVASSLSNVRINAITSSLLEDSQQQHEAMLAQEEEMRQNMEELQATQEEMARQSNQFISFSNSVNHTMIRADFSIEGTLLYANTKFINKLGYSRAEDVEGRHITTFLADKDKDWFKTIWQGLSVGGKHFEGYMKHITANGTDLWTISTYTCVRNTEGVVEKILYLAIDDTEQKKLSLDYKSQIEAFSQMNVKIEFTPTGDLISGNEYFETCFGKEVIEKTDKTIFALFKNSGIDLEKIWDDIVNDIPYTGNFKVINSDKVERWLRGTITTVKDMYGSIAKVLFVANDITIEKQMELRTELQNQRLEEQKKMLSESEVILNKKLKEAKNEIKLQYKELEKAGQRFQKLLENSLDGIIIFKGDTGMVEFCNNAASSIWKLDKADLSKSNVKDLFDAKDIKKSEFLATLTDPVKRKIVGKRLEIPILDKEGNKKEYIVHLTETRVSKELSYTMFIQDLSVDFF